MQLVLQASKHEPLPVHPAHVQAASQLSAASKQSAVVTFEGLGVGTGRGSVGLVGVGGTVDGQLLGQV